MDKKELEGGNNMVNNEGATDREPIELAPLDQLTWLNTKEAARYLRMSANALRIMTCRGYVRARKFRNRLYFRRIELDRLLESSPY